MKEIKLTRKQKGTEHIVKVDDCDAGLFKEHTYHIQIGYSGHPYARRWVRIDKGYSYIPLHIEIYKRHFGEIPNNKIVDHADGNTLNSQSYNLRLATRQQNRLNSKGLTGKNATSDYKGVIKRSNGKFGVYIKCGIHSIICNNLDEIEAAKLADKIYFGLHGEYARLNFPGENKIKQVI